LLKVKDMLCGFFGFSLSTAQQWSKRNSQEALPRNCLSVSGIGSHCFTRHRPVKYMLPLLAHVIPRASLVILSAVSKTAFLPSSVLASM
jgi:hypothetical protein